MGAFLLRNKRKDTPLLLIVKRRTGELANGRLVPEDLDGATRIRLGRQLKF
jgi:hypothetical protein